MHMALLSASRNAILMGGALTFALGGVLLRINRTLEEYFIEVDTRSFDKSVLRAIEQFAADLGYEPIPEWECPPEELPEDVFRYWMTDKEIVYDSSPLQAV